jgi:hypothetical protein
MRRVSLIGNEQAKLSATYLNGVAVAVVAIGGIAPWITLLAQESGPGVGRLALISVVCFSLSGALHYTARALLRRLRE